MSETALSLYDTARAAIINCATVDEVQKIKAKAEAMRVYARQAKDFEMQNRAAAIRLRAERRAGELLADIPKQDGGDAMKARSNSATEVPATLAEQGITKDESSRWQRMATIPEEKFEGYIQDAIEAGEEATTAAALRILKKAEPVETQPLPSGKYRVIYADPPWQYGNEQHGKEEQETVLETHYPTMSLDAICALPVSDLAATDSVLFLWTTSPKLFEAKEVIDAWGFEYKASIVWDKVKHNVGYYVSVRHEFLLISTRGKYKPESPKLRDSVVSIERTEHSRKPEYFREWIDELYPPGKKVDRIELFVRGDPPKGWARWGNEAGDEA